MKKMIHPQSCQKTTHPSEDDILAHHLLIITEEEDDDTEECLPTVSLDDDFWMEEPVPERYLCIHEDA